MISEELLNEIVFVSSRRQLLDKRMILNLVTSIIDASDEKTKSIFNGIRFVGHRSLDLATFAEFNPDTGYVLMNMDKMKSLKFDLSILSCNLQIVQTIMHEINHVREEYKKTLGGIEAFLINASDNILANNDIANQIQKRYVDCKKKQDLLDCLFLKIYSEIYDFIPAERIAEISAYEDLISSLNNLDDFSFKYKQDFLLLKKNLFKSYARVYTNGIIPISEYFKLINQFDDLNNLSFYSTINREFLENSKKLFKLEDRFKYGLPIESKDKIMLLNKMR